MIKSILLFFVVVLHSFTLSAQDIQSPSEFLGYEIGTQFTRHADVIDYFNHLADNSPMVTYQSYGKTYERRTLSYAVITSVNNQQNIEKIRTDNLKQTGILSGTATPKTAIVWLSYNVHGNEASSTEAAMLTAYKLITEKENWLNNTVVIIDPSVNPDGRDRYVNWYNQTKATPYDVKQSAAEHNEPWPGGRPNHYLFDLNRDWAWATQTETQQRLKVYNQWMPHIHVDFHEQGINEPYYFAPAAEPFHEIITDWQHSFQTEIGRNHAKYFDKEGWLFFTRERFDLLYPSYGDTYPTFVGAIGMTYEQAGHGRAGLGINTDESYVLTLVDRVAHHTTTGLSTVKMGTKNAQKLNSEFQKFFDNSNSKYKSFVLKGETDKLNQLTSLLDKHDISYSFMANGTVSGYRYGVDEKNSMDATGALVVSTNQPKGKMVAALFEPETKLSTPITYDITAWSLPYAYGLEAIASTSLITTSNQNPTTTANNTVQNNAAGYVTKWNSIQDAQFLAALLKADIKVRFSEKPFSVDGKEFNRGSLIITKSDNRHNEEFHKTVTSIANKHNRNLHAASTSFSDTGTDFGSPDVKLIHNQRIALLKGKGTSSLSYGAIWHFFEQQLKYPVTSIDTDYVQHINLSNFDVLILPNGYYRNLLNDTMLSELKQWIRQGGKLIAIDGALNAFTDKDGFGLQSNSEEKEEDTNDNLTPYADREAESVENFITGSIFKTQVDNTHPMAFGYDNTYYSLKVGSSSYKFLNDGYNVAYIKGDAERISGFAGDTALSGLKNSLIFGEARIGSGSTIYFVDDVMFRSFWENGKLFFVNALFLVNNNMPTL